MKLSIRFLSLVVLCMLFLVSLTACHPSQNITAHFSDGQKINVYAAVENWDHSVNIYPNSENTRSGENCAPGSYTLRSQESIDIDCFIANKHYKFTISTDQDLDINVSNKNP